MGFGLVLVTPPTDEPVTLAEAKLHLRVDGSDDDALITSLVTAARQRVEEYLKRQLLPATWRFTLDRFPSALTEGGFTGGGAAILLPRPPLIEVVSVAYDDADAAEQTLTEGADYRVNGDREPAAVTPATTWPQPYSQSGAVRVTYQSGYDPDDDRPVPGAILTAILMVVCNLYEMRGDTADPMSPNVCWLLEPYRCQWNF